MPILSILASLFLIVNLPGAMPLRFVVWLVIGLVVYFAYSRRHSHLGQAQPARPLRPRA